MSISSVSTGYNAAADLVRNANPVDQASRKADNVMEGPLQDAILPPEICDCWNPGPDLKPLPDLRDPGSFPVPNDDDIGIPDPRSNSEATVSRIVTGVDPNGNFEYNVVITAGDGDDSVQVVRNEDGSMDVTVNGETITLSPEEASTARINAGGGDDTITVVDNRDPLGRPLGLFAREEPIIEGGAGNDTFSGDADSFELYGNSEDSNRTPFPFPRFENDTVNGEPML